MYVYVISLTSIKHIQCSDNRGACRYCYGVRGYIYMYETRGVWGHAPPQGKFVCLGETMLHSRPILTLK